MTSEQILAIKRAEDLFPGNLLEAKKVYRELARVWHPDNPDGSTVIFARIHELYQEALDKLAGGRWEGVATVHLQTRTGELLLNIRASSKFELGQCLLSDTIVTYLLDPSHKNFYHNALSAPKTFKYVSPTMEAEFSRYLPKFRTPNVLADGRLVVQTDKTEDLILLRDVITHLGPIDPKHVAWMVSSMLNLVCYFEHIGIVHQDISPDTYFISPGFHSGALLGGWWYARGLNQQVTYLPKRTYDVMPFAARMNKVAVIETDLELVRVTARECLRGQRAPSPMHEWLHGVGHGNSVVQYKDWMKVLEKSFGQRRFVIMSLTADQIYGKQTTKG